VWKCGNPLCGFPHFHTPLSFHTSDALTWGRGQRLAAFYSRLWVIGPITPQHVMRIGEGAPSL